jgi:pyruvate/2-oxoglutarate dehydrogenase complex dihydrolipoamide acyltransferase (E2) component
VGKSQAEIAEAGTGEYVVVHNLVMVRDPDDTATDPKDYTYAPAHRGDRVTLDSAAAERLLDLGAIADPDDDAAKFAEAGMRDPATLAPPPSATNISPESDRVGAIKTVVQDSWGDPSALGKLDLDQLKQVAIAFGVPFKADDDKDALAERILGAGGTVGDHDAAVAARDAAVQQSDLRPDDQIEGREASFADQGEFEVDSPDDGGGSAEATASAREFADEHGIDLSDVEGTGSGGKITQADVVKYHAENG